MTIRLLGAFLVFSGCGAFGFSMASACRREQQAFAQLLRALTFMRSELSYRTPPLSALCRSAAAIVTGPVQTVLLNLAEELDRQIAPDVRLCMGAALCRQPLSPGLREALLGLGDTLGRFDLPGQLRALDQTELEIRQTLQHLREHRTDRLRNYQTLGLCAGAALAILLI